MNDLLSGLGVSLEVQAFFKTDELLFAYGEHFEQYDRDFHRIPTTRHLWMAGDLPARELVITSSAMEAIAYLHFNLHRYQGLRNLAFIAVGNLPHDAQMTWINAQFPNVKKTLVFGNDLLGKIADIRVAAGLRGKFVQFNYQSTGLTVECNRIKYHFGAGRLSLHAFEKASALRFSCRTSKPKGFINYLQQLIYGKSS